MKFSFLVSCLFLLLHTATAQQGIVSYSSVKGLTLTIEGDREEGPDILKMLPPDIKTQAQLSFSATATEYHSTGGGETIEKGGEGEDVHIELKIEPSKDIFYTDLAQQRIVQQRDLLGKEILVSDAAPDFQWRESGATATVAGLPVRHATGINLEGDTLQAWYTPSLAISSGPAGYGGLPGLILKMEIPAQKLSILAENIEMVPAGLALKISPPTEGKAIGLAEFVRLRKKKLAENKGGARIITREVRN